MMSNNTYSKESAMAMKLQAALGDGYKVHYDFCESGMTAVYFMGNMIHEVPNSAMSGRIAVSDYAAPQQMLYEYHFGLRK